MSFYTALTGLNAATASLGVISNNIANVGTTGFKRSRADFGDIFATSPLQKASSVIGQGVALKSVTQEFSQGNLQFSASSLDIAITGDGFFPLKSPDGLQDIYTRNGTFLLNDSFAVVNSAGQALMAASVDSSGKADLENLRKLIIPRSTNGDARETTEIQLGLNLPADGEVIDRPFDPLDPSTYNLTTAVTVFDAGGNEYLATVYYAKTQRASPENPSNKWQTHVYIGDTKLDEFLIQASDEGGETLYVNKYGQVRSEGEIPPQDIARGVTKLFNIDRLTNQIDSRPAEYASGQLSPSELEALKNGTFDIYSTLMNDSGTDGDESDDVTIFEDPTPLEGATAPTNPEIYFHLKVDGSPNGVKVDLSDLFNSSADRATYRGVELARILEARINKAYGDQKYFDLSSLQDEATGDYNFFTLRVTSRDGTSANEASLTASLETLQAYLAAANSEFQTVDDIAIEDGGELDMSRVTAEQMELIVKGLIADTSEADDETNDISGLFDQVSYSPADQNFKFQAKDGGTVSIRTYSSNQLTNAIFDLTSTFKSVNPDTGVYSGVVIPNGGSLRSFNANYSQSDQRYGIKVEFDDTQQVFKILSGTTGDDSSLEILAPIVSIDETDPESPIITRATAAELDALFTLGSSGAVESDSSDIAAFLNFRKIFNFIPGATIPEDTDPVRGVRSLPAEVLGTPIGLNLDNKFKLTADTNTFTVTVDNVTGLIQLPTDREFTKDTFRALLEDRINKLEDSRGRTVNGVKVRYVTEANSNSTRLSITTGTEGNDSFLKITGPSIWGLKDLESARGRTEQWISPPQAENANGVPLYVDREGNETTEAGDFSEEETRELWSPIFLDKGELTFNTRGELQSPATPIRFKATTIGETGATLQFSINYDGTTQFSSPFGVLAQDQNGRPEGDLIGLDIGDDGLVSANYSNGSQKNLAKIVLANFAAPTGLRQIGDASYYATSKSGDVQLGEAGTAGFGTIRAGARERANVDLTAELIDLITAQRAFQANAKAIETNNTLTQAIINIRS